MRRRGLYYFIKSQANRRRAPLRHLHHNLEEPEARLVLLRHRLPLAFQPLRPLQHGLNLRARPAVHLRFPLHLQLAIHQLNGHDAAVIQLAYVCYVLREQLTKDSLRFLMPLPEHSNHLGSIPPCQF